MKNFKRILSRLPEYYLIILAFMCGYMPPFAINPIGIGLIVIFTLQLIFKNKTSGLVIGVLFLLINICFLLALLSEFREFPTFSSGARQLLFGGLPIFTLNLIMALVMILKYNRIEGDKLEMSPADSLA